LGQRLTGEFPEEDHFENGEYVAGDLSYTVKSNTDNIIYHDDAVVYGDPNADGAQMDYELYDDDSVTLPHYLSLNAVHINAYKDAYITICYLSSSYRDTVTFDRNLDSSDAFYHCGDWDDSYDVTSTDDFWTVLLCTGFQPEVSADADPGTETTTGGVTALLSNECLVYYETSEEGSYTSTNAAHEIGHAGRGLGHCSDGTCIMDTTASQDYFCNDCLDELRDNENY